MTIVVSDRLRIEAYEHGWIVKKLFVTASGKTKGTEEWRPMAFYGTSTAAMKYCLETISKDALAGSSGDIDEIASAVDRTLEAHARRWTEAVEQNRPGETVDDKQEGNGGDDR